MVPTETVSASWGRTRFVTRLRSPILTQLTMTRYISSISLVLIWCSGCAESGHDPYAEWDTYEEGEGRFSLRYIAPPWTTCNDTEYEDDCHECPSHLIGRARCGGANRWRVLWVPPALLDPEFLLIPPYKLEVSWYSNDSTPLEQAQREEQRLEDAGLEVVFSSRAVTLYDGTVAAEVGYRGPVHLVVDENPINRPDERGYRVVYVVESGTAYRVALDTAIGIELPEVRDMLSSFTLGEE